MKQYTRVLARVNLDAVEYNIEMMKKNIHKNNPDDGSHQNGRLWARAGPDRKLLEPWIIIWGYAVATFGRGDTDQGCMPEKSQYWYWDAFSLISGM